MSVPRIGRLPRHPGRAGNVIITEVRRVLVAVDGHRWCDLANLIIRLGVHSRLFATAAGVASDAVGMPPSNGADVAVRLLPIALTRSLNPAVLLVPSVIMAMVTASRRTREDRC